MLQVENNFRKILKRYKIKASENEIKAVARLHDILKLRGINVKDEPIIRRALKEGYLNSIPLVKRLKPAELRRVANAIGHHQDVNPKTLKGLSMNKFTKAFINADRLDIVRYGIKVNKAKLFDIKSDINKIPLKTRAEYTRLLKLKNTKKLTTTTRKKFQSILKKYPQLKIPSVEQRIIKSNKAKYNKSSPKQKQKIRAQEKEYRDYKEAQAEYKRGKSIKVKGTPYTTKYYKSLKSPKTKAAYRTGYNAGYKSRYKAPTNYRTNYGKYKKQYVAGYRAAYRGNYNIQYSTGKYNLKSKYTPKSKYKTTTKAKANKRKTPKTPAGFILPKGFAKKKLSTPSPAYYVIVKRRGKWVKLTARPLVKKDARDYLSWSLDNGLERSAFFVPLGKTSSAAKLPRNMIGYYSKISRKLRPYKIRMGKKKQLLDGYIEKNKYIQDTRRERVQLARTKKGAKRSPTKMPQKNKRVVRTAPTKRKTTIKRRNVQKSKTSALVKRKRVQIQKQRTKRKLTPAQRKILLKRLERARAARRR